MAPIADHPVGLTFGLVLILERSLAFGLAVRLGDGIGLVRDWAASLLRTSENVGRLPEAPGGTVLRPGGLAPRLGRLDRLGFAAGLGRGAGLTEGLAEGLERTRLETGGLATAGCGLGRTTRCKAAFRSRSTAAWLAPVDLADGLAEDFGGVHAGRGLGLVPVRIERGVEGVRLATSGAERFPGDIGRADCPVGFAFGLALTLERSLAFGFTVWLGDGIALVRDWAASLLRTSENVGRLPEAPGGTAPRPGGLAPRLGRLDRLGFAAGLGRGAGLTEGLAEGLERTRLETRGLATAGCGLGRTTRCKAAFRSRSTAAWLAPVDLAAGLAEDFGGVHAGRGLGLVPVRIERGVEGVRLATSGAERFPGDAGRVNPSAERVAGTVGRVILGAE